MNRNVLFLCLTAALVLAPRAFSQSFLSQYKGVPYSDSRYQGGPQKIPGRVLCAYYDLGGEGVAYHDTDPKNHGSGELNPADGTYLNEFRIHEGVDISYTKFDRKPDPIDDNPYDKVVPPGIALCWLDRARGVVQHHCRRGAGGNLRCRFSLHVESRRNDINRCEWKGCHRTTADNFYKRSSRSVGLASMASLESGFATFQGSSQQRKEFSHCTHRDEREHEPGLFRFQTSSRMNWNCRSSLPFA